MRIMQIAHLHPDYALLLAQRNAMAASHAQCVQSYLDDGYWAGHTLTPALQRMGHDTFLCVPDALSQRLWCQENGVEWSQDGEYITCLLQVAAFRPDVLYIGSILHFYDDFLQLLPYRPRLIVGWHATHNWDYMRMSQYDLVLSSHGECLDFAHNMGAKHAAYSYPGFSTALASAFAKTKHTDICFAGGYWSVSHPRRNRFLLELSQQVGALGINCQYHLGFYQDGPPCPRIVQQYNKGPVWGRAMLKAFASSRITLNAFCTISGMPQNLSPNMRQLEGMGMGSLMLTENSPNLEAFFAPDKDLVTFADVPELIDKALYYLHHEEERERIVQHGQTTCATQFNMDIRARAFMDKVQHILTKNTLPPLPALLRTLHALTEACRDNPELPASPDIAPFIRAALDSIPEYVQSAPDKADLLLDALEPLPLKEQKNMYLCKALRCIRHKDFPQARHWLRRELKIWPENDPARQRLSALLTT